MQATNHTYSIETNSLPNLPELLGYITSDWKTRMIQATETKKEQFTRLFKNVLENHKDIVHYPEVIMNYQAANKSLFQLADVVPAFLKGKETHIIHVTSCMSRKEIETSDDTEMTIFLRVSLLDGYKELTEKAYIHGYRTSLHYVTSEMEKTSSLELVFKKRK